MFRHRPRRIAALLVSGAVLASCGVLAPLPGDSALDQRLAAFPTTALPLAQPVTIHWNEHQVPFIEAGSDRDLAVALGLVSAHLRLGQMEILRRIAQGRLAEMGGPLATDIDHALRILDVGRAVPEILAAMPAGTRDWVDGFVAGVNAYQERMAEPPHEFAVLGLEPETWQAADILRMGRLASADVNWLAWAQLLKARGGPGWQALWDRLVREGMASVPSYGPGAGEAALLDGLAGIGRTGSNSVVVAGARSASGGALIASDPHLGIMAPNLWMVVGFKSPSYHAVGLMAPGLPVLALGRNPRVAWGGTNLRSASSDLFDVSGLASNDFASREEKIAVRAWFDRTATVRETRFGPVISDAEALGVPDGQVLALRWAGHAPSDELSALLAVNRAQDWDQFREAMAGLGVPGQNMLYADADGHIGQVMAAHLPRRPPTPPADMVQPPAALAAWQDMVTSRDLPFAFDPPDGYLASANNRGAAADVLVGTFFSSNDRILRLNQLLAGDAPLTWPALGALQRDVYMVSAVRLRDALLAAGTPTALPAEAARALALIRDWDGHYHADSAGALAFETALATFVARYYGEDGRAGYDAGGRPYELMADDLASAPADRVAAALGPALEGAATALAEFGTWGAMHRVALAHPLSFLPVLGGRYRFDDHPAGGSSSTIMKTAHPLTTERHDATYGSNARHVSDMADLDANYFVLLGGQDGWFNSSTFLDQVPLWQRGEYIRMPLRLDTVRATFGRRLTLAPG